MRFIANIFWMIFGGIWLALLWLICGIILCVTIVGIPFGIQCFKMARLSLAPYGKKVDLNFTEHPIANTVWAVFGGWIIAIVYFFAGLLNCITIFGIHRGIQCFKLMKLALFPFGADIK